MRRGVRPLRRRHPRRPPPAPPCGSPTPSAPGGMPHCVWLLCQLPGIVVLHILFMSVQPSTICKSVPHGYCVMSP